MDIRISINGLYTQFNSMIVIDYSEVRVKSHLAAFDKDTRIIISIEISFII